jgi:hypothetical protein
MAVTIDNTNKPLIPRGDDISPKGYNRAALYSGKALDFDGVNDYVTVESINDTYKSFCLYFKPDADITSASAYKRLFGIYEQYFGISTGSATGITTGETLIFMPNGGGRFGTTMEFVADTWYHVAVVAKESDNTYLMYINAQDKTDLVSGTHTPAAATKIRLAWDAQGSGTKFDGQIANFKAFSEVLTAAQVADLYNNPEKVVPTGVDNTALKLWLPMQEGAGTTAYDGSGNGNHGTISGATYVHGIGAPVAQTAVIDWNKGTNELTYSEDFATGWQQAAVTSLTDASITAPNGSDSVKKLVINSGSATFKGTNNDSTSLTPNADYSLSIFVKKETARYAGFRTRNTNQGLFFDFDTETIVIDYQTNNTANFEDYGNGWYKLNFIAQTSGAGSINFGIGFSIDLPTSIFDFEGDGTSGMYIWGAQLEEGSTAGPYTPTIGTAQTSPVLLPQGLTTGRDITGVNLFENVRKQGALNLDGKSWAEVHDNESLDFGTGSFTLEAWVKIENINTGAGINAVFGLGGNATAGNAAYIETNAFLNSVFRYDSGVSVGPVLTRGDWAHIVGVFDGTNTKIYSNGVLEDTDAATAVDMTNSEVKLIGRDSAGTRYYKDQIAQPRIYNRALTAEEVQRNYDAEKNTYTN